MIKQFTHDDLIKFIYNDCRRSEHESITRALIEDENLFDSYKSLIETTERLDCVYEPSETSVEIIMQHIMHEVEN